MRSLTSSVDTCEATRVIRCPIADLHSLPHAFYFIIPHRKGFGITYRGHADGVQAVVWSPDGKRIASASLDKTVQVWDATNGGHLFTYRGHTDQVFTLAWSPDGKYLASAGADKTVQVWDATDGKHVFTYTGHTDQ